MRELTIGRNDAGQRLDKFLTKTLYRMPGALMQKYIRTKKIKVNRKRAEGSTKLAEGDTVQLFIREEFFEKEETGDAIRNTVPHLRIVYEDANILICDKKPGELVHPDETGEDRNTLLLHIRAYLYRNGEYRPEEEQSFAPSLCNRIDRNTGGMVIAAKNAEALREMNRMIREDLVSKYYLCAVHGVPSPKTARLTAYLRKDTVKKTVTVSDRPMPGAKTIVTEYKVLSERGDSALLEVALLTGRTHQIRAHLAYIGHPLLGDGKYGKNQADRADGYRYQALYSYRLVFGETDGVLADLSGKEFRVPTDGIWFCADYLLPEAER